MISVMSGLIAQSIERLRSVGVQFDPGLSDREVSRVQDEHSFAFGPEHREFLQLALPIGEGWPDWRNGSADDLHDRLSWPIDSAVFDVHHNGFWPSSWGDRPEDRAAREGLARAYLGRVPRLVPLYSHRYLTADPAFVPSPIFSVHQTDVIYYGDNLLDYIAHEFGVPPLHPSPKRQHVPFWSELADGIDADDL